VRADKVSLRFALPSRTDIGSSTLTLSRTADGRYAATGGNLSINGAWQVAALIQGSTSAVEVPLRVTPRTVPPKIDRIPSGNGLTLFTIHLSSGSSAQIYIDPNRPGAGKFHVTFFDAKGNELSISTVSLTMTPPAAAAIQLQPQRLTPGHFVADATFAKGSTRFIISATAGSGEQLDAQIDITPGS